MECSSAERHIGAVSATGKVWKPMLFDRPFPCSACSVTVISDTKIDLLTYLLQTHANSTFRPFWAGKWVEIHVIISVTEVERTNGRPGLHRAVRRWPKSVGAVLAYRLCARSVCDVQRCYSCSCRLWHYISVTPSLRDFTVQKKMYKQTDRIEVAFSE